MGNFLVIGGSGVMGQAAIKAVRTKFGSEANIIANWFGKGDTEFTIDGANKTIFGDISDTNCVNKIKTENSLKFNPELSLKKGNYSKFKPNKQDQLDIKKAIKTLNSLREYNFSQGVVVRNKKVVSIEGKGGTKKMLEKSRSKKFRNHGVLVKFPKKKQDLRVDLPTIGLKTIKQSKTAGLKGIVIKSKQHVFLDKKSCIQFANKNKMFIAVR